MTTTAASADPALSVKAYTRAIVAALAASIPMPFTWDVPTVDALPQPELTTIGAEVESNTVNMGWANVPATLKPISAGPMPRISTVSEAPEGPPVIVKPAVRTLVPAVVFANVEMFEKRMPEDPLPVTASAS